MPVKEKEPFQDDLNQAIHSKRWIPLGGKRVAVLLLLTLFIALPSIVFFMPQMSTSSPLRPDNAPKLETYASPDEDPRRVAWVGNHDFLQIVREFMIDLRMPVQHGLFPNCSTLLVTMRTEGYTAHLYVMSAYTTANNYVDSSGVIRDATLLINYTAADCGALIRQTHPEAKILCLVEGRPESYIAAECYEDGLFIMTMDEAVSTDTIETDLRMTGAEATIRDLIELPLLPPGE